MFGLYGKSGGIITGSCQLSMNLYGTLPELLIIYKPYDILQTISSPVENPANDIYTCTVPNH